MRLFDEIKDHEVDLVVNTERPLPRGLVTVGEHGAVTLACVVAETALALSLGPPVFVSYAVVLAFTLVMRQEFFIGPWLGPKMELYAIVHTFSAGLQGGLIFAIATGLPVTAAPRSYLAIMLGNWFIFNVFEFGRKTFGREEERDGVDSYSLRLHPLGAVLLVVVNMALAWWMLNLCAGAIAAWRYPAPHFGPMLHGTAAVSLLVCGAGLAYVARPDRRMAKLYRGVVSFYLLAYHLAIIVGAKYLFL